MLLRSARVVAQRKFLNLAGRGLGQITEDAGGSRHETERGQRRIVGRIQTQPLIVDAGLYLRLPAVFRRLRIVKAQAGARGQSQGNPASPPSGTYFFNT